MPDTLADMTNHNTPAFNGQRFAAADFGRDHGKAQQAARAVAEADGFVFDTACASARKPGSPVMLLVWNQDARKPVYIWTLAKTPLGDVIVQPA